MTDTTSSSSQLSESAAPQNGPAWAALFAASIGCVAFGAITDVSEIYPNVSGYLNWYRPAGALSGVAMCAIVFWLGFWRALNACWKNRNLRYERTLTAAIFLFVLIALVSTFPLFYGMFKKAG